MFRITQELDKLPAVYFHYEFSPIMASSAEGLEPAALLPMERARTCCPAAPLQASFAEGRRSLSSFLTGLCAIVGGVFTVAGMLDSAVHRMTKWLGARE